MTQVVTISFYRFGSFSARLWAFSMMGLARPAVARIKGIGFWKLCGSGSGEGFTPLPNTSVYAVLAVWPDLKTAQNRISDAKIFARYRVVASENWTVFMATNTVKGAWANQAPFATTPDAHTGPLAVLTRATLRKRSLAKFWKRVPNISNVIGHDPNVMFKIGIGEIPWLHQVTFSIWPDAAGMNNFARTGPHAAAITAVRSEGWFNEELYARFTLLSDTGTWGGASPLKQLETL